MSSAGPSQRRRQDSPDDSQSQHQTQNGSRRKRPRGSLRDELFDKPDLEEKARIVAGYRDMQMAADGELFWRALRLTGRHEDEPREHWRRRPRPLGQEAEQDVS